MSAKKSFDKNIIYTLILVIFIGVFFVISSFYVNDIATKSCFDTLDDVATQAANNIRFHVESDREQLEVIADLIAQHEDFDSETVKYHLASFQQRGSLSAVGLLLPDNSLLLGTDDKKYSENFFDYDTELARLPYLSGVTDAPENSEIKFLYQTVPVQKNGQTIGILYGFINLADFAENITITAFDGNVQLYVIDGSNGDFLIDTWHDTLGNMYDEDLMHRKVKAGYDYQYLKDDAAAGRSGHIAFWSNTAQEYFYSYYTPIGVNQWCVQVTVPESIAFANAIQIRRILYFLAAVEIIAFAVYFLWVLAKVHRDTYHKEQQLAQSLYMYDVQQTLFDAHTHPDLITVALQKVSQMLTAENSFLAALDGSVITKLFLSSQKEISCMEHFQSTPLESMFPSICKKLLSDESVFLYPDDLSSLESKSKQTFLTNHHVSSLMLTPILNSSGALIGILGAMNMAQKWQDAFPLECVARNFMMALTNIDSYQKMEQMSIIDALTGLRNRNCYEQAVNEYAANAPDSLCCLYMDANGLHELNNTLGHAAGDEMLIFIGQCLKELFGILNTYRIGGDEFVAFCTNCRDTVHKSIDCFCERMESRCYHISIGKAWLEDSFDVRAMVASAESNMYEVKRQYYQKKGNLSNARIMNQKLEQILLEKNDADAFLDVISSRFMGVYVVNMKKDFSKVIFKPSYFSKILEQNHYRFIPSMQTYINSFVSADCQADFLAFLDYGKLQDLMVSQKDITHFYQKTDGTRLVLHVYPTTDYSLDNPESFWVFEKDSV